MHLFPEAREAMIGEEEKESRAKTNETTLAEARKKGKLDSHDREKVAGCRLGTDSGPRA